VLLVTKAVGDFLGTNGIADEMIRFNGFPFLEKEDHAYNVTGEWGLASIYSDTQPSCSIVASVMKKELHTLTETGMSVKDIGNVTS
jgi:chloride channel 3/4/5